MRKERGIEQEKYSSFEGRFLTDRVTFSQYFYCALELVGAIINGNWAKSSLRQSQTRVFVKVTLT